MVLIINAAVQATLTGLAREASPREACGFVLGHHRRERIVAEEVTPTINAAITPGSFAIPDIEVRRVVDLAAQAQLTLIAVYHSHPQGSLSLSTTDTWALKRSRLPWVLVGPSVGAIAAYARDGVRLVIGVKGADQI